MSHRVTKQTAFLFIFVAAVGVRKVRCGPRAYLFIPLSPVDPLLGLLLSVKVGAPGWLFIYSFIFLRGTVAIHFTSLRHHAGC